MLLNIKAFTQARVRSLLDGMPFACGVCVCSPRQLKGSIDPIPNAAAKCQLSKCGGGAGLLFARLCVYGVA